MCRLLAGGVYILLAALLGGCYLTDRSDRVSDGFELAYCWRQPGNLPQALAIWQQSDSAAAQALLMLEKFRNQSCTEKELLTVWQCLLQNVRRNPDAINSFALAELLNESGFSGYDPYLAALLYSYSADKNFPPALARWGAILLEGKIVTADPARGEKLLLQAAAERSGEAAWHLHNFYNRKKRLHEAENMLQQARALAYPATFTDSAYQKYHQALSTLEWSNKTHLLETAARLGAPRAALALAVIYSEKPLRNWYMAHAGALLAYRQGDTRREGALLLNELDKQEPAAFIMSALWQNDLKSSRDLAAAMTNSDAAVQSRELEDASGVLSSWEKLLQQEPEAVYRSGLILRLIESGIPMQKLSEVLKKNPPGTLAGAVTYALAGNLSEDSAWQLESSTQLLSMVKKRKKLPDLPDSRYDLLAVIPGVAELPELYTRHDQHLNWCAIWNLSVLLHAEALCRNQGKNAAEKFLQKHFRYKLAEPFAAWEKSFARRYAAVLLQR